MNWKVCNSGLAAAALVAGLLAGQGCGPDTELGGSPVPNALPDTRLVGQPPTLRETEFSVRFFWTGSDPDGRVAGFQWKMSNNGTDGISVYDTLTFDPATGDTLNPWRNTTATDSLFLVKADIHGFPDDLDLAERDWRSYQTHTLFVRAVDQEGGVDPTPAAVSFTATTIIPTIKVDYPTTLSDYKNVRRVPPTVTFGWTGADPDFELGAPVRVRYLWKRAVLPTGAYLDNSFVFNQYVEYLVSFADSAWSDWKPYAPLAEDRRVTFANQTRLDEEGRLITYLFAIQAQDTAGAVSIDRSYSNTVHNVSISDFFSPGLTICEAYLGCNNYSNGLMNTYDIAQNQPLQFSWIGNAETYAGTVVAYRYGWDVIDPDNPDSENWAVQPGNTAQHRTTPVTFFSSGSHTLTVQCFDDSGKESRVTIVLNVVRVPDVLSRQPLLMVDDVSTDKMSNAWPDASGIPQDTDLVRDAFWDEVLSEAGGVVGYNSTLNSVDLVDDSRWSYRDIVEYRSVIWAHRRATISYVARHFDPMLQTYVWLTTFQEQVGNLFMVGSQSIQSFAGDYGLIGAQDEDGDTLVANGLPWILPIIFGTSEEIHTFVDNRYAAGFGYRLLPDGTRGSIGEKNYGSKAWGLAAIDATSHAFYEYPGMYRAQDARKSSCVGLKGIILDPAFKTAYVDPGALADTILTARNIDFKDYPPYPAYPDLAAPFIWKLDEYYDPPIQITSRTTPIVPVMMADGRAAIEPMWRLYSRFEWIDDLHEARGDFAWPSNQYTPALLTSICGPQALALDGHTRLEGVAVGVVSHQTELTKPTGRPDVLWGFDPARFDRTKIKKAIRWVLAEQFGLTMSVQ